MDTPKANKTTQRAPLAVVALLAVAAIGSTAYLYNQTDGLKQQLYKALDEREILRADQLTTLAEQKKTKTLLDQTQLEKEAALANISELEQKLNETEDRANRLAQMGERNASQAKELAALKQTAQQLRDQLASARSSESELRASVERANAEREALAHQLAMRETGARMVNNAVVDATRGRKAKLTVKARRTNELHVAFDLPTALAKGANFVIVAPSGLEYTGADPVVSASRANENATASVGSVGTPGDASARVDLKFNPKKKLEAGVYRIDVSSGKDYLQSFYLNLR